MTWREAAVRTSDAVDTVLERHRVLYYVLLFAVPFLILVAMRVLLGDGLREAVLHGVAFSVAFVAVSLVGEWTRSN